VSETQTKWTSRWYVFTAILVSVYLAVSLAAFFGRLRQDSYNLKLFGDGVQFAVLAIAFLVIFRQTLLHEGRSRTFWLFMSFGALLWLLSESEWVWYELVKGTDVPDPSVGDVLLFIHTIPIMGALVLRAHALHDRRRQEIDTLDFLLLLLWWVFLYAFIIMPWQFTEVQAIGLAGQYYSILYFIENLVMIMIATRMWTRATGPWHTIYGYILLSGLFYALCSVMINLSIHGSALLGTYYTGSLYDVPLVAAMCFFVLVGLEKPIPESAAQVEPPLKTPREWPASLATLTLLAMPAIALGVSFFSEAPAPINDFRIKATLAVILALTFFVFLKQRLLNQEMKRLLQESQQSYINLRRMQDHLVNSEKLAALGQLVAGAAHEINNPLTAILGYSELVSGDAGVPEPTRSIAEKIGAQARRTKRLVSNLLSFAQQQPAAKGRVQVNSLLSNVLQLREPDLSNRKIHVKSGLDPDVPDVLGDGNHLLQVFLHIVNNAVDALQDVGGGILTVNSSFDAGRVVIEFSDTGPGIKDPTRIFDPFYTTKPIGKGTGLGLSVCYGIIQDHGGQINCFNNPNGGATFLIKLPPAPADAPPASESKATLEEAAATRG